MNMNNAEFNFEKLEVMDKSCLILVPQRINKCWTISQTTAIGPMLREEIKRENLGSLELVYKVASYIFEFIGHLTKIDKAVFPQSYGFSTNLYEAGDIGFFLDNIKLFQDKYKDKAIILKSLNIRNIEIKTLKTYKYLPTRIIWYSDDIKSKVSVRSDTKSDNRAFTNSNLRWVQYSKEIDSKKLLRLMELYRVLYLDKYSRYNPDFTEEYLIELLQKGILSFRCLVTEIGEIVGFLGICSNSNEICAPMIGYDKDYKLAPIYRIIMNEAVNEALRANKALNHSAGASKYKANRGFSPLIEYMIIIDNHLPWWRRLGYTIISFVFQKFEKQLFEVVTK